MSHAPRRATLDDRIAREAIPFSLDSPETVNAAVDQMIASLGASVEMLGFGEALHGSEDTLILRNRLFARMVAAHGYVAIAIESSYPRGHVINEYVAGRGPSSYEEVQDRGFSHGFGRLEANRELVEWMRLYNADPSHRVKLRFYGFDIPGLTGGPASPRQVLEFALDYLASVGAIGQERRERIDALLGQDAQWENTAALMDPSKAVGLSPDATALRIETEDLITELRTCRADLVALSDEERHSEALHYATVARQLLSFHAAIARKAGAAELLAIRDLLMADNLAYVVARERGRGKVLVFAHNAHLQRGKVTMPIGADVCAWWPAGSHVNETLGPRYAVIASAVGVSDDNGIGQPEAGTLEARLLASPGAARLIPTHRGEGLPAAEIAALPMRSGSRKNPSYQALTPRCFADFDWLAVLNATTYNRGGRAL
jgi:erythromycin esterase